MMEAVGGSASGLRSSLLLLLPFLILCSSAHIAPAADAEAHLKKDVAEAPSAHRRIASVVSTSAEHNNYEGSGSFDWSDDEDLALEGSGSGSPPIIEDVTPSEPPPRIEIVPEIRMAEKPSTASPPTVPRDSIDVIEVQATTTRSSNAISYSIVAPILTAFFALRFVGF